MAGPNLPGDNEKKNAIQLEEEQGVDLRRNEKPDPAVSVGLTAEEIGMNAKTTNSLQDATKMKHDNSTPSGQEIKEEGDAVSHVYASGLDDQAAIRQYNDATSGAGEGRISGTIFDTIEQEKMRVEEERKRDSAARYLTLTAIDTVADAREYYAELEKDYDQMVADGEETMEKAEELTGVLDDEEAKLQQAKEQAQARLDELRASGRTDEATQAEIEGLTQQIEGMERMQGFMSRQNETLTAQRDDYVQKLDIATQRMTEAREAIADAGGMDKATDAQKQALEEATTAMENAQSSLHAFQVSVELRREMMPHMSEYAGQLRNLDPTQRQEVIGFMMERNDMFIEFASDGQLTIDEQMTLDGLAAERGIPEHLLPSVDLQEKMANTFAEKYTAKEGMKIEAYVNGESKMLEGQEALDYLKESINAKFDALKTGFDKTTEAVSNAANNVWSSLTGKQAEEKEQGQIVYERATFLNEKMTTGTEQERDEARIGAAILGANQSMLPVVITDSQGREVYKDYESGNDRSYYHMDENGEKQFYDPNGSEVESFENWQSVENTSVASGFSIENASMQSSPAFSSPQVSMSGMPTAEANQFGMNDRGQPMIFKNNAGDMSTYYAKWERMQAQEAKVEIQGEINALYDKIDQLNELNALNENQAAELNALQEQYQNGDIDLEVLNQKLTDFTEEAERLQQDVARATEDVQATDGDEWTADEELTLEADEEVLGLAPSVNAQIEGSSITREALDQALSDASPEARAKIEAELERTGIEVKEPENEMTPAQPVASMAPTTENASTLIRDGMTFSPIPGITAPVQSINVSTPSYDQNGIYPAPAASVGSFADTLDGPAGEPTPSYAAAPLNNGTANLNVTPSDDFAQSPNQSPTTPSSSGTPSLAEQQRLQQDLLEQRMQELEMARLGASGGGMGGGGMGG